MKKILIVEVNFSVQSGTCRVTAWDADHYYWKSVAAPGGDGFRKAINALIDAVPPRQNFVMLDVTGWQSGPASSK
jgi:hypothetical protein